MIEPTPACAITTRAARTYAATCSYERNSTQVAQDGAGGLPPSRATNGSSRRPRPEAALGRRSEDEGEQEVLDPGVCRAVGVDDALAGEQRARVALVEGDPGARERLPRLAERDELREVAARRADEQDVDRPVRPRAQRSRLPWIQPTSCATLRRYGRTR